jgi:hypothetical protein
MSDPYPRIKLSEGGETMHPFISKRLFLPILIATGLVFSVIAATAAERVDHFPRGQPDRAAGQDRKGR